MPIAYSPNREADGKIVAIHIETGDFELADTTLAAAKMFDRAASAKPSRMPNTQLWFEHSCQLF